MDNLPFSEQWKIWAKVAVHSFGGPAGQIAVIHKLVVEDKKFISEEKFLHALNFCMLLPGPEAQQLATYLGWLMGKWRGGLIAGGLFILPGFLSILLLSYLYVIYSDIPLVQGIFYGIKPGIIAIVLAAFIRIAQKALKNVFHLTLALFSFTGLFFFNLPFPIVIVVAAIAGAIYGTLSSHDHDRDSLTNNFELPVWTNSARTLFIWLLVWLVPIGLTLMIFGKNSTFHAQNLFFSKMSMVTFGGAYAALSYVAQKAVEVYGWLTAGEMLNGLALAESTPGPLIQTVQFVGFMGAYRFPDIPAPYFSAFIGSVLTTWMTFAPCFLWIFTFAPYVEYIRGKKFFADILQFITAAVVGVIFNLSLWFGLKTLFMDEVRLRLYGLDFAYPLIHTIDLFALTICLIAFFLQFKLKQGIFTIMAISCLLGIIGIFIA
jgi:chromate transporter